MNRKRLPLIEYCFLALLIFFAIPASASIIDGTISSTYYKVQVCETTNCAVSTTSGVNFGHFTTQSQYNIEVLDTELKGFMWGSSFGWVVMNCVNTTSGCSSTNGNFKVANNYDGRLSGYAWGQSAGWINFGPFLNSTTAQVVINSSGQFNGYAWAQNFGWIKFDCSTSDTNFCVQTDWRPRNTRPQCSDGLDNDGDNIIDSADPGCHPVDANASNSASYDPTDNIEAVPSSHGTPRYTAPAPTPEIIVIAPTLPLPIEQSTTTTTTVRKPRVTANTPSLPFTPPQSDFPASIPPADQNIQPQTLPDTSSEVHYLPTFLRAIGSYLQMIPSSIPTGANIPPRIEGPKTPPQTPISVMPSTVNTPAQTFFQKVVKSVNQATVSTGHAIGSTLSSIGTLFNSLFSKLGW